MNTKSKININPEQGA